MTRHYYVRIVKKFKDRPLPLIIALLSVLAVSAALLPELAKQHAGISPYTPTYSAPDFASVRQSLTNGVSTQRNRGESLTLNRVLSVGNITAPTEASFTPNLNPTSNYFSAFERFKRSSRQACQLLDIPPPSI